MTFYSVLITILEVLPLALFALAAIWRMLGKVLWACRVSVVSAFAGYYLFLLVLQAQDLFADTVYGNEPQWHILYWASVFTSLFIVWAFPVHYAARRILDAPGADWFFTRREVRTLSVGRRQACFKPLPRDVWLIEWTPRILGCIPIVAFLIGIVSCWHDSWSILPLVKGLSAQFILLTIGALGTLGLFIWFTHGRTKLVENSMSYLNAKRTGLGDRVGELLPHLAVVATLIVVITFWAAPLWATHLIARSAMIPFLFGSFVLPLSWLASHSHKVGRPLVLFGILGLSVLTAANTSFNDLRRLPESPQKDGTRQSTLDEAILRWRAANGCAAKDKDDDPSACPPALIVASEGGASRAAFFTAAVVGHLLDRIASEGLEDPDHVKRSDPSRRIFAMSGVSGGAFGVASIKAALLASDKGQPPCIDGNQQYFVANKAGNTIATAKASHWHDCLEMLVDGDYLSPVFAGLGYRDNFAPPIWPFTDANIWGDRAALLERAWEEHFLSLTVSDKMPLTCEAGDTRGLCRPFGYANRPGDAWTPLLLLNGTSVQSGRRIIASELRSTYSNDAGEAGHPPLYQWAYDVFEMLGAPCPQIDPKVPFCDSPAPAASSAPDIRLSTGALLSARFPLISPAGTIRMHGDPHGDSVVDGGYFENSGLSTALDIARALHKKKLRPIVLSISNEPIPPVQEALPKPKPAVVIEAAAPDESAKGCGGGAVFDRVGPDAHFPVMPDHFGAGPTIANPPNFLARMVGTLAAPASALYNTRTGHGDEAGALIVRELASWPPKHLACGPPPSFFPVKVFAKPDFGPNPGPDQKSFEMPKLSMSWWLSPVVQEALDRQLAAVDNARQFDQLMLRLDSPKAQ